MSGIGLGIAKISLLHCNSFFEIYTPGLFFWLVVWHQYCITLPQSLASLQFLIHPSRVVHWCSKKRLFGFSKALVHYCFEETAAPNIFENFPVKHPWWIFFKYTCRPSWKFPKNLFRAAIL